MPFRQTHLLGIEALAPAEITTLLDLAETYAERTRKGLPRRRRARGASPRSTSSSSPRPAPRPPSRSPASGSAPT